MTCLAARQKPADARRHASIQFAVLFFVVAGFSWNYDAWLFVRMKIIANDAFAFGNPDAPLLLMDDGDELRTFSPTRIAEFLYFPTARIRAVAYLSLAERSDDRDPQPWVGVAPKLLQALACETDDVARSCAKSAAVSLPMIPEEDLSAVLAFVESPAAEAPVLRAVRTALVAKVVRSNPELLSWAVGFYERWLDSPDADDRRTGFGQLAALAPNAPETIAAFRAMVDAGDPDHSAAAAGRRLMRIHPELIDECLKGGGRRRAFIAKLAAEERYFSTRTCCQHPERVFSDAQLQHALTLVAERH